MSTTPLNMLVLTGEKASGNFLIEQFLRSRLTEKRSPAGSKSFCRSRKLAN
jgi:hypothetical protein